MADGWKICWTNCPNRVKTHKLAPMGHASFQGQMGKPEVSADTSQIITLLIESYSCCRHIFGRDLCDMPGQFRKERRVLQKSY